MALLALIASIGITVALPTLYVLALRAYDRWPGDQD